LKLPAALLEMLSGLLQVADRVVGEIEEHAAVEERELHPVVAALALRIRQQIAEDIARAGVHLEIIRRVVAEAEPREGVEDDAA